MSDEFETSGYVFIEPDSNAKIIMELSEKLGEAGKQALVMAERINVLETALKIVADINNYLWIDGKWVTKENPWETAKKALESICTKSRLNR